MWAKRVGSFLLSVALAYALAVIAATQAVVGSLDSMGVDIGFGQRLEMVAHDLLGMTSSFLPLIAIGFLIAFVVTGLILRRAPGARLILYPLAGGVALVAVHLALHAAFGITPVAAARTIGGLLLQGLAGAVGGYVFARVGSPA